MYAADYAMLRAAAADTAFACRPEHEAAMQRDVAAHARLPPVNALIVALVRNEGAWLPEWIEHHALLGVGRFALYDDGSADETAAVLAPYVEAGLAVLHHVGDYCLGDYNVNESYSSSHNFLQQPVMLRHAAAVHAARSRWVVFVDADEYIWIGDGRLPASLPDLLERVSARRGAAAEPYAGVYLHGLMVGGDGAFSSGMMFGRPLGLVRCCARSAASTRCAATAEPHDYGRSIHNLRLMGGGDARCVRPRVAVGLRASSRFFFRRSTAGASPRIRTPPRARKLVNSTKRLIEAQRVTRPPGGRVRP